MSDPVNPKIPAPSIGRVVVLISRRLGTMPAIVLYGIPDEHRRGLISCLGFSPYGIHFFTDVSHIGDPYTDTKEDACWRWPDIQQATIVYVDRNIE